jgi:hypothetical protein
MEFVVKIHFQNYFAKNIDKNINIVYYNFIPNNSVDFIK